MPAASPKRMEDCLKFAFLALIEIRKGHFDQAKGALAAALLHARHIPKDYLPGFRAALSYCTLLIQSRHLPASMTSDMRSQAGALLEESTACDSIESFQHLMFELLTEFGEQRRAIPFGERALTMALEKKDPIGIADWLWKIGGCYSRLGLHDHAAVAYRRSAQIFRKETADPRLPVVLLALGNSIRKSAPSEAEELYKEAAALWEAKGQLESATPAWMNLGIVCSDLGRFEEALNYYERVRSVRESSPLTPPVRIGTLYNNIANCYRKMARFADAHQAAERSIGILTGRGVVEQRNIHFLGASLGTKGLIFRDEGRHSESVEWFRRATAQFESQPSPNTESILEELEHEAEALTHLNRDDEARAVKARIQEVRKAAADIPSIRDNHDEPVELADGALLIELDGGLRGGLSGLEVAKLGNCLSEILKERKLGVWHGLIRIPESSTLVYYGSNAEAMYNAVEPALQGDSRFEGRSSPSAKARNSGRSCVRAGLSIRALAHGRDLDLGPGQPC